MSIRILHTKVLGWEDIMKVQKGRVFVGRFESRSDLLDSLTGFCKKENIRLGAFTLIGALSSAKMGYYKQDEQQFVECLDLKKKLEITSCVGNVSLKDGEVFVHAHITLADHAGQCYGGHLMPGATIFAVEYYMEELVGAELNRIYDEETGLNLWVKE
ncbi:MAG: hypothetical protein A2243_03150 [Omnitrophica WOR_2 bacterium RIFOXYA2_FULL_38_17]|nr:MAG: hypothetical protein A2243_03150 [Omnitrophica WOR_2 bacterium RIFOXYA2_FULL_38_17]OGX54244.1 MAG: hypothetical protein A2267_04625 [Omnitrophica WOR_2 bacterium RIFOXYA12_FULL_38_10]OGX58981.1 MAG: hypothetical protein A2447_07415 [Omnitrophica WOR_2 bacterium RIFOXYC2_FULL_38_12]